MSAHLNQGPSASSVSSAAHICILYLQGSACNLKYYTEMGSGKKINNCLNVCFGSKMHILINSCV